MRAPAYLPTPPLIMRERIGFNLHFLDKQQGPLHIFIGNLDIFFHEIQIF
jgi:hypothetical protein